MDGTIAFNTTDGINDRVQDILHERYFDKAVEAFVEEYAERYGIDYQRAYQIVVVLIDDDVTGEYDQEPYFAEADQMLRCAHPELPEHWDVEEYESTGITAEWYALLDALYLVDQSK